VPFPRYQIIQKYVVEARRHAVIHPEYVSCLVRFRRKATATKEHAVPHIDN
jgi:hypothetical protein